MVFDEKVVPESLPGLDLAAADRRERFVNAPELRRRRRSGGHPL